jgi:hypothetical protein
MLNLSYLLDGIIVSSQIIPPKDHQIDPSIKRRPGGFPLGFQLCFHSTAAKKERQVVWARDLI